MKLQQLRYIWEVAHHDLNVSATAQSLYTSQPGISKQIRLLEDELDVEVFTRSGKHLTSVTPAGAAIIKLAGEILGQVKNIKRIAQEFNQEDQGELRIACSYTQSRHILPAIIARFKVAYPEVVISLFEGSRTQIEQKVVDGEVDFAIGNEGFELVHDLVRLPCFSWKRQLMVPRGHVLSEMDTLSLEAIAEHPLIGYVYDAVRGSDLINTFKNQGIEPKFAFTAADAEVLKNYVKMGLGVGIVTDMDDGTASDPDLLLLDSNDLLPHCVTYLCANRNLFVRAYMYDFIELIAPHMTQGVVKQVFTISDKSEREDSLKQFAF